MKKYKILLLSYLIILGCAGNEQKRSSYTITKFPIIDTLKFEKIKIHTTLLEPRKMQISDSFLIILEPHSKPKFKIFQIPDCKLINEFGIDGRGPEEFFQIATGTFTVSKNNRLAVIDRRNRIRIYDLIDCIRNKPKPLYSNTLPMTITPTFQMVYDGDSIIYGHASNEELNAEVYSYNLYTHTLSVLIEYPNKYIGMSNYDKSRIYIQRIGLKPNGSKLVSAFYYFKKLRIFSLTSGKSIEDIYEDAPDDDKVSRIKKTIQGYDIEHFITFFMGDLRTTNKYIYAEMYNKKIEELDPSLLNIKSEIHVFDWNANPKAICRFKEPIDCFAITSDNKYLYAASSKETGYIKRYKLNFLFSD